MLLPRALSKLVALALLGAWFTAETSATSWIACIDHNYDAVFTKSDDWVRAGAFGRGACEGYVYNYPGFTDDKGVVDSSWKVDTKKLKGAHAPICQYKQHDATYNDWRREIHAQPGDKLFVGYMPNGHVVRDGKGVESTWGVYWSGDADHELTNASELTQDRLVDGTLNNFDDGNCGLTHTSEGDKSGRAGDPKPCVGSFSIPSHTKPGRYQMVWYWTAQGTDGDKVAYSSCFDVIIKDHQQDMDRCGVDRDAKTTAPPQTADPLPTVAPTTTSPPPARTTRSPLVGRVRPATFAAASTNTLSSFSAPLVAVTYNGVGGSGLYGKVTAMDCPSTNTCTQSDFAVSGPMAPFDEDLTLALRGPLGIDGISVFTSADGSVWSRASSYSKQDASSDNMVFLNNKGDPLKSGVFDTCNGNSQSYATSDGTTAASAATPFSGVLDDGVEVNIMSSHSCAESGTCGVTRGVAQQGWSGNNKIFMIKGTMPNGPSGSRNLPAIWLLNGQIVRTAQYGCNCRGVGDSGQWKGGCGEIDVAEALAADPNSLTSTMYSFKGSRGTSSYAPRPVDDAVVFVVILTEHTTTGSTSLGMAQILMMWPEDVDMTTPPTNDQVQQWLSYRNGVQVDFDI